MKLLKKTVSFPNDSHLVTETPILMTKVTLENCDEKTESLIEKQQVQSSLSAKSYASVLSLHNSGNVPISIKTYMTELGLEVPHLLEGTHKMPTSSNNGSCCFAALAQNTTFKGKSTQELRIEFQRYVISKGVKKLYTDLSFPHEVIPKS